MRALLIDDERPAIDRLSDLLKRYPDIDVVGTAQDGISALTLISEKNPDVVFLDIEMPELSGLEVARTLGVGGPMIIFATAFDEHALEAFESCAIDYIVKPINRERLHFTIEKLRRTVDKPSPMDSFFSKVDPPKRLAVKIGSRYEVFDPNLISVAQARDDYTALLVEGREFLSDDSLDSISTRLDPSLFMRVHRGALINVQYLKELRREGDRKYIAILSDKSQSQVSVSRERLTLLKKFLGLD